MSRFLAQKVLQVTSTQTSLKDSWWKTVSTASHHGPHLIRGNIYWKSKYAHFLLERRLYSDRVELAILETTTRAWVVLPPVLEVKASLFSVEAAGALLKENALPFEQSKFVIMKDDFLPLLKTYIKKPWGQEVWHTGSEKRGVCHVKVNDRKLPLPYYELAMGSALQEEKSSLILLKELEPFDIAFYGELYTELHEEKDEVYIVSELPKNRAAEVKLGLKKQTSLSTFRKNLTEYEAIRRQIDEKLAELGVEFQRTGLEQIEELARLKKDRLPRNMVEKELECFERIRNDCQIHGLALGDVVRVPTHTPHALQPGTKVVEFQSPVYERKILASNQKVLTQNTLDIEEGIGLLQKSNNFALDAKEKAISKPNKTNNTLQTIASFAEFKVLQGFCTTNSGQEVSSFTESLMRCQMVYILEGNLKLRLEHKDWQTLSSGESYLIPQGHNDVELVADHVQLLAAALI